MNKKYFLLTCLAAFPFGLTAQENNRYEEITNPKLTSINREPARSTFTSYVTEADAVINDRKNGTFRLSLNGKWKFHYVETFADRPTDFMMDRVDASRWPDINVPGNWELQGFGTPIYVNQPYEFCSSGYPPYWDKPNPPYVPQEWNPTGTYRREFTLPGDWDDKEIFLSADGVRGAAFYYLNGKFVGMSKDAKTPARFNVSAIAKKGKNVIAIQIHRFSDANYLECQDFWRISGIERDIYLYAQPQIHLTDFKVESPLDENYRNGILKVKVQFTNESGQNSPFVVGYRLLDKNDQQIAQSSTQVSGDQTEVEFTKKTIQEPLQWTAETPNLYTLVVSLKRPNGDVIEATSCKVGFRTVEIKDKQLLVNGQPILVKGVNYHEHNENTGHYVSEELMKKDFELWKRYNVNTVRTCHYPQQERFYELCDEYGIYMIAECNMESHGSWDISAEQTGDFSKVVPCDRPEWMDMMLDRVNSMYQRDKNHPAILIWSCGNESFGGKVIYEMSQLYHKMDPNRLVHYEGVCHDRRYNDTSDMESQMYPSVDDIKAFLEKDRSKPFICCEYTHAMGNSCGGMHKYTDLTDTEPSYQGGFIWDYIDQSIYKKDRYGKEFQAYGGDFNDRPCDYNFSGNGIAYGGERDASPKMQDVKFNYQNISAKVEKDQVTIVNKNLFINTDTFDCFVALAKDGKEVKEVPMETHVAPLSEETVSLPIPVQTLPGEYAVTVSFRLKEDTVWAKRGHEVAFGQGVYKVEAPAKAVKPARFEVIRSGHDFGVRGENFDVLFSYLNGGLASYRYGGVEMIQMIPRPNFWRAPVDNDNGSLMQMRCGQWKLASMYLSHKYPTGGHYPGMHIPEIEVLDDSAKITFTYAMPTTPATECKLSYQVYGDGSIRTTLTYDPVEGLGDMPEFGVMFKFDADYDNVTWYGMGPEETYVDRCEGAKLGIYRNKVEDNMAKYMVPQECGNKVGVRWASVTDRKGRGMLFTGDAMEFSALPYTPHEMENAMHPFELPQVHYTVVRVSKQQMGIAGDDSWGAKPLPEYLIKTDEKMEFTFTFKGI